MKERNSSTTAQRIYLFIIVVLLILLFGQRYFLSHRMPKVSGDWDKLQLVLEQIEQNYVDSIQAKQMVEQTLPHVLEALDPHSVYLPPMELKEAEESLEGNFDGIGITFNVPNDTAVVMNVISGGPSERAGVQPGDRIAKVNDKKIAGVKMPQDSMVSLFKGPRGSKVTLAVMRYGLTEPVLIPIVRDKIPAKSVDVAYMIDNKIGYIKLSKFSKTSYLEILEAMRKLTAQGMQKLIFDIRDNGGGYLEQALRISNEFLDKGQLIVYTQGAHRVRQDFFAEDRGLAADLDLVVLVNEQSASSSEIMAGALQDNDRGIIVGRRTYGKGLVQEPIYFSDKSGMRLTVGRFYTPTGRSIQRPYNHEDNTEYRYDLLDRYRHGELTNADSIPKNDSLKFVTPKGKVVYGGGGIIPDIFVPLDTTRVSDFYLQIRQKNLPIRFSIQFADGYRAELKEIKTMESLNLFLSRFNLEQLFLNYAAGQGVVPKQGEWAPSKEYIITPIKAYIGRATPMDDQAFYPIWGKLDDELKAAVKALEST